MCIADSNLIVYLALGQALQDIRQIGCKHWHSNDGISALDFYKLRVNIVQDHME